MKSIVKVPFALICLLTLSTLSCVQTNQEKSDPVKYSLPDPLISEKGKKIKTTGDWNELRRKEVLELFEKNMYGKVLSDDIEIEFDRTDVNLGALDGKAIRKNIAILFKKGKQTILADLLIYLPADATNPAPLFLGLNFYGNHTIHPDPEIPITTGWVENNEDLHITENKATEESRGIRAHRWPVERILERGYGLATICYGDIDPDYDDGFDNGVHALMDYTSADTSTEPSSISAWAWGLSAAMDYFETDRDINQHRIVVMGHSRLGKTSLWAGATDPRFAIVISNNSGCGGAALSRRKHGETVKRINTVFPHWFCDSFNAFNDKEDELPFDQHMLIALIAPRPVYVASAVEDDWADPEGEFLSMYHAGPVFKLFGMETIAQDSLPELNTPLWKGNMGYHIRSGKHDVTLYDWEQYLNFADLHFLED